MSLYCVQRTMFRLKKDKAFARSFAEDKQAALTDVELTDEERAALTGADLAALYTMGVHPLLLAPYSRAMGIPRQRYQELLDPLQGLRRLRS